MPVRLYVEVWLYRHGWALPCALIMTLLTVALTLFSVDPTTRDASQLQVRLQNARNDAMKLPDPEPAAAPLPAQRLRSTLGTAEPVSVQLARIAQIARRRGIDLPRAQYTAVPPQSPSGLEHTEVTLGFVAGYPRTRAFIESTLLQLPNASVDRIGFSRDLAKGTDTEVTLRITLWRLPAWKTDEGSR